MVCSTCASAISTEVFGDRFSRCFFSASNSTISSCTFLSLSTSSCSTICSFNNRLKILGAYFLNERIAAPLICLVQYLAPPGTAPAGAALPPGVPAPPATAPAPAAAAPPPGVAAPPPAPPLGTAPAPPGTAPPPPLGPAPAPAPPPAAPPPLLITPAVLVAIGCIILLNNNRIKPRINKIQVISITVPTTTLGFMNAFGRSINPKKFGKMKSNK